MTRAVLALAVLVACDVESIDEGTLVGNPGNMDVAVYSVPDDISLDAAVVAADQLLLLECDGRGRVLAIGQELDGIGASGVEVPVPAGRYCAAILVLSDAPGGSVALEGVTDGGTSFAVGLDVAEITHDQPFTVDGDALLLGIGLADALDAAELDTLGPDVQLSPDDPLGSEWSELAGVDQALWIDTNDDGAIDDLDVSLGGHDDVRDTGMGPAADLDDPGVRADAAAEGGDAGCSCGVGSAPGWLALLAVLAVLGRRRL